MLSADLGWKVTIVSITVDPEHDGPAKLREYAHEQGADKRGWFFLTGSAADVDRALAGFKMFREKGQDGSVGHLVDMILLVQMGGRCAKAMRDRRRYETGPAVRTDSLVEQRRFETPVSFALLLYESGL